MSAMLAASLVLLIVASPPAEGDAPALSSFVVGERVLLVSETLESALAIRTRDELEALGFFVVLRDDDEVIDVVSTARTLGAVAAVEVHGLRLDIWADVMLDPLRVAHAVLVATEEAPEVTALRAAELVRARVLRPRPVDEPSAAPAPSPAPPILPPRPAPITIDGALGVEGFWAVGSLPLVPRVAADVAVVLSNDLILGVDVAVPTAPARITKDTGDADLLLTSFGGHAGWRVEILDGLDVTPGIRAGATWLRGTGRSRIGTEARDGDLVVGHVAADTRLTWMFAPPIGLFVDVEGGALAPRPVVGVGTESIAVGPFSGAVAIGFTARFGAGS